MGLIKSFFGLLGFVTFVLLVVLGVKGFELRQQFDANAPQVYWEFAKRLYQSKSPAVASTWRVPVEEGIAADEVEETMKLVANELNIKLVAELPLYKQVAVDIGKPYRYVKIFMFCNATTAAKMLDYSDAFGANLPCRVTLIESKSGQLWLYALNMDMMIYGGKPLPVELKEEALKVKSIIQAVMERAASGDF